MATLTSDRYTALPTDAALAETVAGLERRGFGAELVEDLDAARRAVLARIPAGASVMTYPSVTLEQTRIMRAIDEGGRYDSARGANELGIYRTLFFMVVRHVPGRGPRRPRVPVRQGSHSALVVFIFVSALELPVVGLLLPWLTVRLIVLLLSLWTLRRPATAAASVVSPAHPAGVPDAI